MSILSVPTNKYLFASMDNEKQKIMKAVSNNKNIAINSDAGTGKSYLVKSIIEGLYNVSSPKVLFLCFNTAKMLYKAFITDKGYLIADMLELLGKIDTFTKKCTLTTIHKSKGMTYTNTALIFMEYFANNGNKKAKNQAFRDYCQKYVACTRAKYGGYFVNNFVPKQDENRDN